MVPGRHSLPLLGKCHHRTSVQHSEPEEVIELQTDAIHRPMETTFRVEQRVAFRCEDCQVLDVPPAELRTATQTNTAVLLAYEHNNIRG